MATIAADAAASGAAGATASASAGAAGATASASASAGDSSGAKASAKSWGQIDELLEKHAESISALRECCDKLGDFMNETSRDPIWLLRYVLSFRKENDGNAWVRKAAGCIQRFHQWRATHDEILSSIEAGGDPADESEWKKHVVMIATTTENGGPCNISLVGRCNFSRLMDCMGFERVVQYHLEARHKDFVRCDRQTRLTRELVKMTSIMDLTDLSMLYSTDRRWVKSLGKSSTIASEFYPQLLHKTALLNSPSWLQLGLRMVKPFMSQRSYEKIVACGNVGHQQRDALKLSVAADIRISDECTPDLLGGQMDTSNIDLHNRLSNIADPEAKTVVVSARTCHEHEYEIQEGVKDAVLTIQIEARDIKVGVTLQPAGKGKGDDIVLLEQRTVDAASSSSGDDDSCSFTCPIKIPCAGTATLRLDNKHSYLRSKSVSYCFKLVPDESLET